jgi:hypothetical protein
MNILYLIIGGVAIYAIIVAPVIYAAKIGFDRVDKSLDELSFSIKDSLNNLRKDRKDFLKEFREDNRKFLDFIQGLQ